MFKININIKSQITYFMYDLQTKDFLGFISKESIKHTSVESDKLTNTRFKKLEYVGWSTFRLRSEDNKACFYIISKNKLYDLE